MAPSPSPAASSTSSTGLFSNVINFVSREFESFVSTATGAEPLQRPQNRERKRRSRDERDDDRKERARSRSEVREPREREEGRRRASSRYAEREREERNGGEHDEYADSESEGPRTRRRARSVKRSPPRRRSASPAPARQPQEGPAPVEEPAPTRSTSLMPPPPVPVRAHVRETMPGSLYPRSPSLMPESPPLSMPQPDMPSTVQEEDVASPESTPTKSTPARAATPEAPALDAHAGPSREKQPQSKQRRRNGGAAPSEDIDAQLMPPPPLPNGKGKSKATEPPLPRIQIDAQSSSEDESVPPSPAHSDRARFEPRDYNTSGELRVGVAGKERELRAVRAASVQPDRGDDERESDKSRIRRLEAEIALLKAQLAAASKARSPMPPPPPPPLPPPPVGGPAAPIPIAGPSVAERANAFLANARATLKHKDVPVEAPINPPRLGRKGLPTVNLASDKMAAFLKEMKTVRLRKVGADKGKGREEGANQSWTYGEQSFDLGAARAVEVGRTGIREKRKWDGDGLAERKAKRRYTAFDFPTRSVQARKDDITASFNSSTASSTSQGSSSSQTSSTSQTSNASQASSSSSQPSTSVSAQSSNPAFARSYPGRGGVPRNWPSIATTETDITTPSLCSDNENEQEHESEERSPPTPPATHDTPSASGSSRRSPLREAQARARSPSREIIDREIIDVEMHSHSSRMLRTPPPPEVKSEPPSSEKIRKIRQIDLLHPPRRVSRTPSVDTTLRISPASNRTFRVSPADTTITPTAIPAFSPPTSPVHTDPFAKRVPISPLPPDSLSPAKPRPPGRVRNKTPHVSRILDFSLPLPMSDYDDDPLALSSSPPRVIPVRAPSPPRIVPVGAYKEHTVPLRGATDSPPIERPPSQMLRRKASKDSRLPVPVKSSAPGPSAPATSNSAARSRSNSTASAKAAPSRLPPPTHLRRRRRTLDEEIQSAGDALWQDVSDSDLENGELTAFGTRSTRRGFLKGGGAAGKPVFMGVGYVEGAVDSAEEAGDEETPTRTAGPYGRTR